MFHGHIKRVINAQMNVFLSLGELRLTGVECDQLSAGFDVLRPVYSKKSHQIHIRAIYCTFSTTLLLSGSEKDSHCEMNVKSSSHIFELKLTLPSEFCNRN